MKKLLALVLCIVMVLSLAPAAFAADDVTTYEIVAATKPTAGTKAWASTTASKDAISNAKKDIEYVYGTLAADTAVFGAVKNMDSIITDLAKGLFDGIDSYTYRGWVSNGAGGIERAEITLSNSTLVDNTKSTLRGIIGSSVTTYLNKHIGDFTTVGTYTTTAANATLSATGLKDKWDEAIYIGSDGNYYVYHSKADGNKGWYKWNGGTTANKTPADVAAEADPTQFRVEANMKTVQYYKYDPIKYANAYAAAVTDAFTSEKGAKGIEALVYSLYYANAAKKVSDDMSDLKDEILAWEGTDALLSQYGFNESWNPYSFLNDHNAPKTVTVPAGILTPADSSAISTTITVDPWYN